MRRIINLLVIFAFILFTNIIVKADISCQSEELKRLKSLANNVEISYKENIKEEKVGDNIFKDVSYSITAANLDKDIKVMIINDLMSDNYKEFKSNTNMATLNGFKSGEKVTITILAFVSNGCSGKTLLTKNINLPYYNIFSEEDACKEYPEFKYCTTWIENSVSRETFENELTKYIDSIKSNNRTFEEEKIVFKPLYIIVIAIVLVFIAIVVIVIIKKQKKKSIVYNKHKGSRKL